jgi:hypothetical protein
MIQMSKKQAEFFTILILICTVTAAAILIIDYQIKGSILEQSNRMRKDLERFYGQRPAASDSSRYDSNDRNDPAYPSDMVGSGATGMEATGPIPGSNGTSTARKSGGAKRTRETGSSGVPGSGQ